MSGTNMKTNKMRNIREISCVRSEHEKRVKNRRKEDYKYDDVRKSK